MKIKSFECPKSVRYYKDKAWNIGRLVNESFIPSTQGIIIEDKSASTYNFVISR